MNKGIGKYECSSASAVHAFGVVAMILLIICGAVGGLIVMVLDGVVGFFAGAITVILGIFLYHISSCIAIITENQYRQALRAIQNNQAAYYQMPNNTQ